MAGKGLRQARGALVGDPLEAALGAAALLAIPVRLGGPVVRAIGLLLWMACVAATLRVVVGQYRYAQRLLSRVPPR